jgi:hypothetical protein
MVDIEHKTEILRKFKAELADANFEQATLVQQENQLSIGDIMSTVNTLFTELIDKKHFTQALEVGRYYRLDSNKLNDLINLEFARLFAVKEYENAIKWANEYNLSESEAAKAASKFFQSLLEKGDIDGALEIPEKYRVKKETFETISQQWFNEAYQRKEYFHAAMIGAQFSVSPKRVLLAARSAFLQAVNNDDLKIALRIQREFDLFSDTAFGEIRAQDRQALTKVVFAKGVMNMVNSKRYKRLEEFLKGMGLFDQKFKTKELHDLASQILVELAKVHNELLEQNQLEKATLWYNRFSLLDDFVPSETRHLIIRSAESFHNMLLERLDIEGARNVKHTYGLFKEHVTPESLNVGLNAALVYVDKAIDTGEVDGCKKVIEDYDLPIDKYMPLLKKGILHHLRRRNFEPTFDIIKKFKVDVSADDQLQREAKMQFDDSVKSKLVEIAAEIGVHFKLDKAITGVAALQAFERHLKYGRYDKAYQIYRANRLPRKNVMPIIKEVYEYNSRNGNEKVAERLRRQYHLDLSIMETIFQLLRKFGMFK